MLRHFSRVARAVLWAACLTPILGFCPTLAQEQAANSRLQAQLDSGEFGPAMQAAAALPRGKDRDATFARVAAAQAQASGVMAKTLVLMVVVRFVRTAG